MDKKKRALEIADEIQKLGYPEIADKLREAVTSGKQSNEQSESNEGGEGQGGTTTTPPTGGGSPPPDKERP